MENETAEVIIQVNQRTMRRAKGGSYKVLTTQLRSWLKTHIGKEEKSRFGVRYGKSSCWYPSPGYRKMLYGDTFSILTNDLKAAVLLKLTWSE
jgi:hypothetical protein